MKKFFGCGCGFWAVILVLNLLFGGYCTQYTFNFWASQIKKEPVHAPFVPCAIVGAFLGEVAIPAAGITWIVKSTHMMDSRK